MEFATGRVAPTDEPQDRVEDAARAACEACGRSSPDHARFCQHCGALLPTEMETSQPREAEGSRDGAAIVTAVVCEISSGRSQQDEAEPTSGMWGAATAMEEVRTILERHGGSVDDLPGSPNTLVAVFGPEPPTGHGPLRAARAAAQIRDTVPELADELGWERGMQALVRAGVGTSEVMGDDPGAAELWQQRVIDLAVRLQRMAEPGEVIVAEEVYRRIAHAAEARPVNSRSRMGDGEPVGPLRLLDVSPDSVAGAEPALVGRERELTTLQGAFDRAVSQPSCSVLWVVGDAGIGKTRLVEEFLKALEEGPAARVIRVRCRPSSEGGTTWPVADIVEQAAGVSDRDPAEEVLAKLHRLLGEGGDTARIAERLVPALGLPGVGVPEETPWAIRRLLEAAAGHGPLVVFVDDADRAGPAFSRVLRNVAGRSRDAAILIVCIGRSGPDEPSSPHLGDDESTILRLEPLTDSHVASLLQDLLGTPDPGFGLREALTEACRGNPFVAEQLVALLIDRGHLRYEDGWRLASDPSELGLPTTIDALLEARLSGLDPDQRALLGLAAAAGETFPTALVAEFVPEGPRADVSDGMSRLVAGRILRAEPPGSSGQEVVGFRHSLFRRAATAGVPEDVRANVHERYAGWLEEAAGERAGRYAELVGSQLETACRLRRGTGPGSEDLELARRAAQTLARAAAGAAELGDTRGAVQMWLRASSLLAPDDGAQPSLLLEAAVALAELGEGFMANGLLTQASRAARASGDRTIECRAKLLKAVLAARSAPDGDPLDAVREAADSAAAVGRALGDEVGLAWAWSARALVRRRRGHWAAAANASERAADHAARAGRPRDEVAALRDLARTIADGPAPVPESLQRCEAILERVRGHRPAELEVTGTVALLMARMGQVEPAREFVARAASDADGLGLERERIACLGRAGQIEALAGELEEAEWLMREALDSAGRLGDGRVRAELAALLANVLEGLGRQEEALSLTEVAELDAATDDVATQVRLRAARAKAMARMGGPAEDAKALAREAVQLADQTDLTELRAGALLDLAEVLRLIGRPNEAVPLARRALRTLERKGAEAAAGRARALLGQLDPRVTERAT